MKNNNIKCITNDAGSLFDNLIGEDSKGRLLRIDEVARLLSLSQKTIRYYVYVQKIPFLRVGGAIRFHPRELERWVKEAKCRSGE